MHKMRPSDRARRLIPSVGAILLCVNSLGNAATQTNRADSFSAIADAYSALDNPEDTEAAGAWVDASPARRSQHERQLRDILARLEKLPPERDPTARFSRSFLEYVVRNQLSAFPFDESRIPFSNGQGFFRVPGAAANTTVIRDKADALKWIARLTAVPGFYDLHIANMRRGLKDGFTQPIIIVDQVLQPLRAAVAVSVANDALLKPFARLPASISGPDQDDLRRRATELIEERIRPAQRAAVTFMEKEYRPGARTSIAARDLPDGEAYYRFLVRKFTTTNLTPEEVHALGKREVEHILTEMETLIRSTGFSGTVADYNELLRKDPANYVASPAAYAEKASEAAKRADRAAPAWFGKLPRLTWGPIFKTPEQEGTANVYMRGSPEDGVPGSIMMSYRDATSAPLYQLSAWVFHEGVPGHHLQIALSQENAALPAFRREARITPFIEGWALYAERLAGEMGLYRDAKERYGRLSFEMYRACRLVMDTGIHWMRWSRDEAKQCLAQNTALSPSMVEFETNRYISQPGQALAYKIGELRIRSIRDRAEKALGPNFRVRAFHDALLGEGPMPLDLLDEYMDRWIARTSR